MALDYISYALSFIITLIILFFIFYRLWFLRNPERSSPKGDCIVSPANGKIVRIIDAGKKNMALKKGNFVIKKGMIGRIRALAGDVSRSCWIVVIVMTPFHVHYQRAPFEGRVIWTRHSKGRLFNAVHGAENLKATLMNEKNEIMLSTKFGRIKIIQVAGFLAKRIKCFVSQNQNIKKGQDIGLIKMGSQVCIILPKSPQLRLKVSEGQEVIDGETIIAEKEE